MTEQDKSQSESQLHTSELLQNLLRQHSGETIRLGELIQSLGSRAFGPTLLICALPEALPLPIAGVSAIIGTPLLIFSVQLLLGYSSPRLPKWLSNRTFRRKDFEKAVREILRYLHRFEKVIRPRWQFATTSIVERWLGLLFVVLAVVIMLPIPFGNFLPAIAIVTISLGLIEADGVLVVVGSIAAVIILAIMAGAIVALFSWVMQWLNQFLRR
ncbi:exopolysaccharide biosynthesis protein [Leptolyngbya sp. AN03gr2]|uniref:exopolysaccharide biosynthesis protein n=1 Tax=unclassified Leptolyngbya TaxID=2650499 RepID=UPI003D310E63